MEVTEYKSCLLWRHGFKDRNDEFMYDPVLMNNQNLLISNIKHAINTFGEISEIIVSPLQRTRETAQIMKNTLNDLGYNVNIEVDCILHEIEKDCINKESLRSETLKYYPEGIPLEDESNIRSRVYNIIDKYILNNNKKIWIVTHGSLIKKITSESFYKLKRIEEGCFIYLFFDKKKIFIDFEK